jgi:hypothetical protein
MLQRFESFTYMSLKKMVVTYMSKKIVDTCVP